MHFSVIGDALREWAASVEWWNEATALYRRARRESECEV